jgi:hypothetical protein
MKKLKACLRMSSVSAAQPKLAVATTEICNDFFSFHMDPITLEAKNNAL